MIIPELHKKPVALDRVGHRDLKVRRDRNPLEAATGLNAFFLTAAEFIDACRDYPILFLPAGQDEQGKALCAPVAALGLQKGENLFWRQGRWDARYVPAMLRAYPFAGAPTPERQLVVCIDEASEVWSREEGEPLFDADGQPTPYLAGMREFVEKIEIEIDRTRQAGRRLLELGLLEPRRFDATLPDGSPLTIDGFLGVNEEKLAKLPDDQTLELARNGLLALLHFHLASLRNMTRLLEVHAEKRAAEAA
ncbi:MAG: SapC family protein [Burkholderiales bacterium]|nr:SapC family protein [Burkholderiales bacterium]